MQNKYFAKRVITNDGKFDSIAEYNHWLYLKTLPVKIERQVTFKFIVNGVLIGRYIADFVIHFEDGRKEVHDVKNPYLIGKGKSTPTGQMFNYKKKLLKALHNIELITISNGENRKNKS